ncbi:MAG: hypothetical protein LKJ21_01480 [Oscillospiraceae bacterium]|jgi:hypothetical protein|nr:hypothetical protein [Oscillospiraceae bacterium]MCI1990553.1 hypothetical protein [Oscillospiraceae bacterium]MCI2034685.1 hypothetical protein [Oscillospiraceae bacterium]
MARKTVFKIFAFCLAVGVVLTALSKVFVLKTVHTGDLQEGLYLSDDSYDVVFMGGSHMNGGMDPNVLWEKYGISSFNYATGGQPIAETYHLLREVLQKHKNPVVVLDVFYLAMSDPYGDDAWISIPLDNMRFSWNKLETIRDCTPPSEWIYSLVPILKYHYRWSELTINDLFYDNSARYYAKGFGAGTNRYGKPMTAFADTEEKASIPAKNLEYLNKIIELSKSENFPLVFVNLPCDYSDTDKDEDWVDDCEALFNTVADLAEQNGIPFLDYYDKIEEIGLDFPNDMNNAGHLNVWGAGKVSAHFGNYLKQNYSLADHRDEPSYAQWWTDYRKSSAYCVLHLPVPSWV